MSRNWNAAFTSRGSFPVRHRAYRAFSSSDSISGQGVSSAHTASVSSQNHAASASSSMSRPSPSNSSMGDASSSIYQLPRLKMVSSE